MLNRKRNLLAWGIAACSFAAALASIATTRPMFIARAAAEISKTEVSPEGLAKVARVSIAGSDRMLPTEIVTRLRSLGTIRRALKALHLPADDAAVAEAASRIGVRLIAGTTVIEAIVRSPSRETAPALATALFSANEEIRHDRRVQLSDTLLASLDDAMIALQAESKTVAAQLESMELQKPAGAGRFNEEMDRAFVNVASEKGRLRATLARLEAIESSDVERQVRELDDVSRSVSGEHAIATLAGYTVLRGSIAERSSDLARSRAQYGENSAQVKSTKAELAALYHSLQSYLIGQVAQIRAQLAAMETAGQLLDARDQARVERSRAIEAVRVSPESESLLLKREAIRRQLGNIELRRRELMVFRDVFEPSLFMLDAPRVSAAPEVAQRSARIVLAAFGALLVGFSLSIIFDRRALAVI